MNRYITPAAAVAAVAAVARYRFAVEHGLDDVPTADEIRENLAGRAI